MREHLTLTATGRRWTIAIIVVMTTAATLMTVLHTVRHDVGLLAAAITIVVMIGFPAVAGVYGSRLRRAGEHLAADVLLTCTSGAVISMVMIWWIWVIGSVSL